MKLCRLRLSLSLSLSLSLPCSNTPKNYALQQIHWILYCKSPSHKLLQFARQFLARMLNTKATETRLKTDILPSCQFFCNHNLSYVVQRE